MTLRIPDDLAEAVEAASKSSGVPAEELAVNVLRAHFPSIGLELQSEFDAWQAASDDAIRKVDELLGEKP